MNNVEKTKKYFNKNILLLKRKKINRQREIINATASLLNPILKGRVLDIGSGGSIDYSLSNIRNLVCVDISSKSFQCFNTEKKIEFISADARNLSLKDNLFDYIILLHTVHHLTGNNLTETIKNVKDTFGESYRVLKRAGKILIIDAICLDAIQRIESLFFNYSFFILGLCGKPMVYYFSLHNLMEILNKTGFRKITFSCPDTGRAKFCPFTTETGIPFKYTPLSHVLIEGVK